MKKINFLSLLNITRYSKIISYDEEKKMHEILRYTLGEPRVNLRSFSWHFGNFVIFIRDISDKSGKRQVRIKSL